MIIALCLNSSAIEQLLPDDYELFERFPGSGFIGALKMECMKRGVECLPGRQVANWLYEKKVDPSKVWILQEESCETAESLKLLGITKGVLFCLESPLYTPEFYKNKGKIEPFFKGKTFCFGDEEKLYFPSYSKLDLLTQVVPWENRKDYGWVTSNQWFDNGDPKNLLPYRAQVLSYFSRHGLELGGQGWIPPRVVENKRNWLSQFKFTFCIENYEMQGYVTEKIIHALVAGVIPVYIGAPNINEFVPPELYVNPSREMPMHELREFLESIDPNQARNMISMGQEWLEMEGLSFRYDIVAERVLDLFWVMK